MKSGWLRKLFWGDCEAAIVYEIPVGDIVYDSVSSPSEGVMIARLAENIYKIGQLQPVLVRRAADHGDGKYKLITGRRRLEAVRMLGKTTVKALIIECKERDDLLLSASDNYLHGSMSCFEMADSIACLVANGSTISELSRILGASEDVLRSCLALNKYSPDVKRLLSFCCASVEEATALSKVPEQLRLPLLERVIADPDLTISSLVNEYVSNPVASVLQCRRIWSADLRLFANTIQRCVNSAKDAGVHCTLSQSEDDSGLRFVIFLSTSRSLSSTGTSNPPDVSRETSDESYRQLTLWDDEDTKESVTVGTT